MRIAAVSISISVAVAVVWSGGNGLWHRGGCWRGDLDAHVHWTSVLQHWCVLRDVLLLRGRLVLDSLWSGGGGRCRLLLEELWWFDYLCLLLWLWLWLLLLLWHRVDRWNLHELLRDIDIAHDTEWLELLRGLDNERPLLLELLGLWSLWSRLGLWLLRECPLVSDLGLWL